MNAAPDALLSGAEEKVETTRQDQETALDGALVEMGKVSDTQGGWIGKKPDTGFGVQFY
jgi:hypothetical protein